MKLSCQSLPLTNSRQRSAIPNSHWTGGPMSGRRRSEKPSLPDFNRLKCKSVSGAFGKQKENFVPSSSFCRSRSVWVGFFQVRTRWTRSRIHGGGTERTPCTSSAASTRWVSSSVLFPLALTGGYSNRSL